MLKSGKRHKCVAKNAMKAPHLFTHFAIRTFLDYWDSPSPSEARLSEGLAEGLDSGGFCSAVVGVNSEGGVCKSGCEGGLISMGGWFWFSSTAVGCISGPLEADCTCVCMNSATFL